MLGPRAPTRYVVAAPAAATVALSVAEISAEFRSAEAARGCGLIREDWSFIVVNIRAGGRGWASTKWETGQGSRAVPDVNDMLDGAGQFVGAGRRRMSDGAGQLNGVGCRRYVRRGEASTQCQMLEERAQHV